MSREARAAGGECIAKVAQLELDTLGEIDDFAGIAQREGLIRLRRLLDDEFFEAHGVDTGDAVLSNLISEVLEISGGVVRIERMLATN